MRRWQWMAIVVVGMASVGGYWCCSTQKVSFRPNRSHQDISTLSKRDSDTESCDVIEPLRVGDGFGSISPQSPEPPLNDNPPSPVLLEPDMAQPPRPDAEPGPNLRMPLADEVKNSGLIRYPDLWIGTVNLERLNIFEILEKADPAEESEPMEQPKADPAMHPHYQHCPYHGGCPAPYMNRPIPRD